MDATRRLHLPRSTRRARWRRTVRANDELKMVEEHEFATSPLAGGYARATGSTCGLLKRKMRIFVTTTTSETIN